jgi:hypothetical protein
MQPPDDFAFGVYWEYFAPVFALNEAFHDMITKLVETVRCPDDCH